MSKVILPLAVLAGLILSASLPSVHAQDSGSISKRTQKAEPTKSFETRFWQYLLSNNYKNWAPPAGQGSGFFPGSTAHGQLHKLYLNRTAAGELDELPDESVIVMENYNENKMLESISVMLRSTGANPSHQDWYWITYGPDGSVIGSAKDNHADGPIKEGPNSSFVSTSSTMVLGSSCCLLYTSPSPRDRG